MEKSETKDNAQQHEDIALKLSTQFFAQELLPYFGIEGKVVGIAPTEEVQIESQLDVIKKKLAKGKSIAEIADAMEETEEVVENLIKEYKL